MGHLRRTVLARDVIRGWTIGNEKLVVWQCHVPLALQKQRSEAM